MNNSSNGGDTYKKWVWMMEWCKTNGFAHTNFLYWTLAEKAYDESVNG